MAKQSMPCAGFKLHPHAAGTQRARGEKVQTRFKERKNWLVRPGGREAWRENREAPSRTAALARLPSRRCSPLLASPPSPPRPLVPSAGTALRSLFTPPHSRPCEVFPGLSLHPARAPSACTPLHPSKPQSLRVHCCPRDEAQTSVHHHSLTPQAAARVPATP